MTLQQEFKGIGKFILYPLILLGLVDFMIQAFTGFKFRLIHRILSLIFGE